jgi:hypothetical protein
VDVIKDSERVNKGPKRARCLQDGLWRRVRLVLTSPVSWHCVVEGNVCTYIEMMVMGLQVINTDHFSHLTREEGEMLIKNLCV